MTAYDKIIENRDMIFSRARQNGVHDNQGYLVISKDDPWGKTAPCDIQHKDVNYPEIEREYKTAAY